MYVCTSHVDDAETVVPKRRAVGLKIRILQHQVRKADRVSLAKPKGEGTVAAEGETALMCLQAATDATQRRRSLDSSGDRKQNEERTPLHCLVRTHSRQTNSFLCCLVDEAKERDASEK